MTRVTTFIPYEPAAVYGGPDPVREAQREWEKAQAEAMWRLGTYRAARDSGDRIRTVEEAQLLAQAVDTAQVLHEQYTDAQNDAMAREGK